MKILIAAFFIVVGSCGAFAGQLPSDAAPLSPDEVAALYSGKTGLYGDSATWFAPDKTIYGWYGKPPKGVYSGTWDVNANEFCSNSHAPDGSGAGRNCHKFWRVGKVLWSLWTVHFDNSPANLGDYKTDEPKALKAGNWAEKIYRKLGGV